MEGANGKQRQAPRIPRSFLLKRHWISVSNPLPGTKFKVRNVSWWEINELHWMLSVDGFQKHVVLRSLHLIKGNINSNVNEWIWWDGNISTENLLKPCFSPASSQQHRGVPLHLKVRTSHNFTAQCLIYLRNTHTEPSSGGSRYSKSK